MQEVKEKGILKGERGNIFGAELDELVERDANKAMALTTLKRSSVQHHLVPAFVSKCICALEGRALLSTDGLYRINGNNAEIQKLRFLAEQEKSFDLMDSKWDVHVLTGALKLFFRELMHPLIPWAAFLSATEVLKVGGATSGGVDKAKAAKLKKIIADKMSADKMSSASYSTLRHLLSHLISVAAESASNRMQASNLGIVFGPSLMWSEGEEIAAGNMAFYMMYQSKLVEFMLSNFTLMFN